MSVFDNVIKFAQYIKDNKLVGKKWVYVDDKLNVRLIGKEQLPMRFYIKGDKLIVANPKKYVEAVKHKVKDDVDNFILIEPTITYEKLIPTELIREHLLSLPIEDIVKMRKTSKEYRDIIDKLWCDLMKRDYPEYKYDNCEQNYKELYTMEHGNIITYKKINDAIKKCNFSERHRYIIEYIITNIYTSNMREGYKFNFDIYWNFKSLIDDVIENNKVPTYFLQIKNLDGILKNFGIDKITSHNIDMEKVECVLKQVLPNFFIIKLVKTDFNTYHNYITISIKDYIKFYNMHNNISFVKKMPTYGWSVNKNEMNLNILDLIFDIVEYKGKDYHKYLSSKYDLQI